jgi:hypothetical protein
MVKKKKKLDVSTSFSVSRPLKYDLEEHPEGRDSVRVLYPPHHNISGNFLGVSATYLSAPEKKYTPLWRFLLGVERVVPEP